MNKSVNLLIVLIALFFTGCNNDDDNQQELDLQGPPPERNLTQEEIKNVPFAFVNSYDTGWNFLTLSSSEEQNSEYNSPLSFHIDIDFNNGSFEEGTYECKNTDSFKRYAAFKCNNVDYLPNDVITIKKIDGNIYSITFSYYENGQLFEGVFQGEIIFQAWAIDFIAECYQ